MPREVIDLSRQAAKNHTFLLCGKSRSGKTYFAGTMPRALFLSDRSEKGWLTLRYMPDEVFYEPGKRPEVWPISSAREMMEAVAEAEAILAKEPDRWRTWVVDSLTFYSDSYLSSLEQSLYDQSRKNKDPRSVYGDLAAHLRYLMIRLHEKPINVVWTTLMQDADPENGRAAGPLIAGRMTTDRAPAKCDYILYFRRQVVQGQDVHEIRTRPFGSFDTVGGREHGLLPDPLPASNYRAFEEALGLTPETFETQANTARRGFQVARSK